MSRALLAFAALHGFLAVAIGAFGAHAMSDARAKNLIQIGATWEALCALAALGSLLLFRVGAPTARIASWLFIIGGALFAWSLYALAFQAPRWVGFITPIGGVSMLCAWGVLLFARFSIRTTEKTP